MTKQNDLKSGYLNDDELEVFCTENRHKFEICAKCKFWRPVESPGWYESKEMRKIGVPPFIEYKGECRKHSPIMMDVPGVTEGNPTTPWWPETSWNDSCGDFQIERDKFLDD